MIKKVVDIYYTALMTFLVFTFADHLLQGLIQSFCIDLFLYAIMWLSLVLQTVIMAENMWRCVKKQRINK